MVVGLVGCVGAAVGKVDHPRVHTVIGRGPIAEAITGTARVIRIILLAVD